MDSILLMENEKLNKKLFLSLKNIKLTMSGLNYLCQSLGLKTCISMRDEKFINFEMITVKNQSDEKVHKIKNHGKINDYVDDFETKTHDFNCGFPLIVHNSDSFVIIVNTKDVIKDLKNLEAFFYFSNLDENHELFGNKSKKVIGKIKIETPKSIWIDEFVCLRSKMCAFNCGSDGKNKLKGVSKSQPKNILILKSIKNVQMGLNINENVIIILLDQLIMKWYFMK